MRNGTETERFMLETLPVRGADCTSGEQERCSFSDSTAFELVQSPELADYVLMMEKESSPGWAWARSFP